MLVYLYKFMYYYVWNLIILAPSEASGSSSTTGDNYVSFTGGGNSFQSQGTVLIDLSPEDSEYQSVEEQVSKLTLTLNAPLQQKSSAFLVC